MAPELTDLQPLHLDPLEHQHLTTPPPPQQQQQHPDPRFNFTTNPSKIHILLCATGSVATIKIPQIIAALTAHPAVVVRLILTESARSFLSGQSPEQPCISTLTATYPALEAVYVDADEWATPWVRGNPILHIELRRWADVMVIAPLSASALAKMTQGWADSLVLSVVRAWDTTGVVDPVREVAGMEWADVAGRRKKRILVAPAMNTAMWLQPITKVQVRVLDEEWGVANGGWVEVLQPMEKELACGDVGGGAMMDWREIVAVVEQRLGLVSKGGSV